MKKKFLNIISHQATVENLYKSGLDDQESILLTSFLLILRKERILPLPSESDEDKVKTIFARIRVSDNDTLKNLSFKFLEPLVGKIENPSLNNLLQVYSNIEDDFISMHLREFFDDQLSNYFGYKGKHTGDAFQPKELTTLMNYFLPIKEGLDYYNPFGGLASLALALPGSVNYYGEELNQFTWQLAKLRMLAYDTPEYFQYDNINSIEQWRFTRSATFDYIAFNPPFNIRLDDSFVNFLDDEEFGNARNANSLIISQCFKKLKPNGKMVFVMPGGFLASSTEKELALKKYLVDNNYLELIISLPGKILNFTSIPIYLLILNRNKQGENIRFIDGSQLYKKENPRLNRIDLEKIIPILESRTNTIVSKNIPTSEIISFNYNLAVNRYVYEEANITLEDNEELVPLSELISRIPRSHPTEDNGKLINIKDLSGDRLNPQINLDNIESKELRSHFNAINTKALLISILGKSFQPTLLIPKDDEKIYTNPNILAFTIEESKVLPDYLIMELYKDYVLKQLEPFRMGSQVFRIKPRDLLSIKIVLPTLEDQEQQIAKERYELYQQKAIEVKNLASAYNIDVADENSFLRHQIAGSLRNVRSSFKFLKSILEEKVMPEFPELYSLKLKNQLPSNLGVYMERMERDIQTITTAVNQAGTEIELSDINVERIDFIKFVQKYKEELETSNGGRYSVEMDIDSAALAENKLKTIYIDGDKELLRKMFDNIIENADKHAFERKINPSNRIKFEFLYGFEDSKLQLDIANTGKPLPEVYSHEAFVRKGSSSGQNAGDGTGGWFINEVMKKHNGSFGFTDETGPEGIDGDFVTSIELYFPIHIK